jgi:hypothetical protein
MAGTLESLSPTLERVYAPKKVVEQLYQENAFLAKVKKTNRYTVGEEARVVVHDGRNGGFTNLPEGGGTLNEAGQQGFHKAGFKYKNHHIQVAVQGEAIDGTQGDANAIVDATTTEIDGAIDDANRQLTRQAYMDGSALIAQCRASSSNDVDLNTTTGLGAIERGWLFVNQPVVVGTKANETAIQTSTLITAIDETNVAFTVAAGNVTGEGTTHYVSQAKGRSGEVSREMNGMRNLVGTGELGGLTSTTSPVWKSTVNSTTTSLTIGALLNAQRKIRQVRGKSPTFMVTSLKQQQRFYELLEQQVNFSSDKGLNAGSDDTTTWNGIEIFADPDCPDEDLYLGHWEHLFMVAMNDGYWQNKITGGNILQWSQGTDAYVGKYTYRANLAVNRRNDLYRFSALA